MISFSTGSKIPTRTTHNIRRWRTVGCKPISFRISTGTISGGDASLCSTRRRGGKGGGRRGGGEEGEGKRANAKLNRETVTGRTRLNKYHRRSARYIYRRQAVHVSDYRVHELPRSWSARHKEREVEISGGSLMRPIGVLTPIVAWSTCAAMKRRRATGDRGW